MKKIGKKWYKVEKLTEIEKKKLGIQSVKPKKEVEEKKNPKKKEVKK